MICKYGSADGEFPVISVDFQCSYYEEGNFIFSVVKINFQCAIKKLHEVETIRTGIPNLIQFMSFVVFPSAYKT